MIATTTLLLLPYYRIYKYDNHPNFNITMHIGELHMKRMCSLPPSLLPYLTYYVLSAYIYDLFKRSSIMIFLSMKNCSVIEKRQDII